MCVRFTVASPRPARLDAYASSVSNTARISRAEERHLALDHSWYVGESVVCIYNGYLDFSAAPELVVGDIYTIKAILPERNGHLGLVVVQVAAQPKFLAFDERRFKPLSSAGPEPLDLVRQVIGG